MLTLFSSVMGVVAGAVQGYYGGKIDLWGQRVIEVWSGMPTLFLIILLSSVVQPNFWWLLGITVLFGWMALVGVVRAEFLRTRNFDYIRAAQALGVSDRGIIFRHMLPNAVVATPSPRSIFWASGYRSVPPRSASCCCRAKTTCRHRGWALQPFFPWRYCFRC